MKQELKYRFFHYDIFVLLTVVLTVVAIHVADWSRLFPESSRARFRIVENHVIEVNNRLEMRASYTFDVLTFNSLLYTDYIYNPDSVYRFCEMLGNQLDRIEAVAVVPARDLYPGRDYFIPVFSKSFSEHAFNGLEMEFVNALYNKYNWEELHIQEDGTMDILADPITLEINGSIHHLALVSLPILGQSGMVRAYVLAALSMEKLAQFAESIGIFEKANLYVVTKRGKFILHPDNKRIGDKVGTFFEDNFGPGAKLILDSASHDLLKMHSCIEDGNIMYASTNATDSWTTFYSVPYKDVFRPIVDDVIFVSIVALIGMTIILLVCAFNIKWASEHRAKQSALDRDLEIAASIQNELLNKPVLTLPSLDIDVRQKPAKTVGGDIYYFYQEGEKLLFCVGDVSGKGVPASLLMSGVLLMLKIFAKHHLSPASICAHINKHLCANNPEYRFVTLFVGLLDTSNGKLSYCNAGHDEPICNGSFLKTSDYMPLGIEISQFFSDAEMTLDEGSVLTLYTDGVTEAMNQQSEMFGNNRFLSSINSAHRTSAKEINDKIFDDLRKFVDKNEQSDDITLLTLRYSHK